VSHTVKDIFPVFVSGKVVVGDEKGIYAFRDVGSYYFFYIVGISKPGLLSLDIDDRAKAAGEWATATCIEATN